MFKWLKDIRRGRDREFPETIDDFWYCGEWYMYGCDEGKAGREHRSDYTAWPVENKTVFNPRRCAIYNNDKRGLIDGLIPARRVGERIGLYKIDAKWRQQGDCRAPFDDGKEVRLKFVRSIDSLPDDWEGFDKEAAESAAA